MSRPQPLLTVQQAADELGLDLKDVRNRVRRKDIPSVNLGGRMIRIKPDDLSEYKLTLEVRERDIAEDAIHMAREMKRLGKPPKDNCVWKEVNDSGAPVYLYFIHNPTAQLIKIGISIDVRKRMTALESATGCELKLLGYHYGGRRAEAALHRYFHRHRAKGEWFRECGPIFELASAVHDEGVQRPLYRRRVR